MPLEITDFSHEGEGIGRLDGIVTFVPGVVPGDVITVRNIAKKKRIQKAELDKMVQPSPDRIQPDCPYFDRCGGCALQHYAYEAGLRWKRERVQKLLDKAKVNAEVAPVIGMDQPWGYRNNMQLQVKNGRVGFHARGSHDVVDIASCPVQSEVANRVLSCLREMDLTGIRQVLVRSADDRAMVSFIGEGSLAMPIDGLANAGVISIWERGAGRGDPWVHRWGEETLTIRVMGIEYAVHPATFFQVNTEMTNTLFTQAVEKMEIQTDEVFLDLYCGIGALTLPVAKNENHVYGVEVQNKAVQMAKQIAKRSEIKNAEFIAAPSEDAVEELLLEKKPDGVFVDPPRAGLDAKVIESISRSDVRKIVYISCDPATLARDLAHFQERGWGVGKAQPVDMFPWTTHVECIALIQKEII